MPRTRPVVSGTTTRRRKTHSRATRQISMAILLSTAMVLGGILLYLWPQMRLVNLGYRQGALQARRTRILQHQKELYVELATLRQLSRIEEIAVQRLGMRPPQTSQIIYVHPERRMADSRGKP
jgi:cell division protein FtsL